MALAAGRAGNAALQEENQASAARNSDGGTWLMKAKPDQGSSASDSPAFPQPLLK